MNRAEAIDVENDREKIALHDVSKFYGDILGVNRISLERSSPALPVWWDPMDPASPH